MKYQVTYIVEGEIVVTVNAGCEEEAEHIADRAFTFDQLATDPDGTKLQATVGHNLDVDDIYVEEVSR